MNYKLSGLILCWILSSNLILGCKSNAPEATVKNFYFALEKGEINEAKSLLSVQAINLLGDDKLSAALVQNSKKVKACGGLKMINVDLDGEGDYRDGTSEVVFKGDCSSEFNTISLIKENEQWKITPEK